MSEFRPIIPAQSATSKSCSCTNCQEDLRSSQCPCGYWGCCNNAALGKRKHNAISQSDPTPEWPEPPAPPPPLAGWPVPRIDVDTPPLPRISPPPELRPALFAAYNAYPPAPITTSLPRFPLRVCMRPENELCMDCYGTGKMVCPFCVGEGCFRKPAAAPSNLVPGPPVNTTSGSVNI